MANSPVAHLDPRQRDAARALLGDQIGPLLQLAERLRAAETPPPAAAPRDPGKFVAQLAQLYCEKSDRGLRTRTIVSELLEDVMRLLKEVADAAAPPDASPR